MSRHYQHRKSSNERYLAKMDEIRIRMPKESGLKDAIKAHAEERGESTQAFILRAIMVAMERDINACKLDGWSPKYLQDKEEGTVD